ncbi:MAG: hypothetical protein LBM66_06025 [Bifidobacteriaceae bacterium]|jgi:hypothetical protein|nr:hypothetical protein [Bifidobacteriaceae bacterium]
MPGWIAWTATAVLAVVVGLCEIRFNLGVPEGRQRPAVKGKWPWARLISFAGIMVFYALGYTQGYHWRMALFGCAVSVAVVAAWSVCGILRGGHERRPGDASAEE